MYLIEDMMKIIKSVCSLKTCLSSPQIELKKVWCDLGLLRVRVNIQEFFIAAAFDSFPLILFLWACAIVLALSLFLFGHSVTYLDEEDKSDEEANTELVVDILDSGADELATGTAQRYPEVNCIAFIATAIHDLVFLDATKFVGLPAWVHLINEVLTNERLWHRLRTALYFLLHDLHCAILDFRLDFGRDLFHVNVPWDLVFVDT